MKEPTNAVRTLVDGNSVPCPGQLLGRRQSCRTGAGDGDGGVGDLLWDVRSIPALIEDLINNGDFHGRDGRCRLIDAKYAGRLV